MTRAVGTWTPQMQVRSRFEYRHAAMLCGGLFLLCALLIWPVLASGMNDDWSIAYSAKAFAETGQIHYNGWEAPMLLWQIWTAGLAIKLFGFTYQIVRAVTILHGLLAVMLFCGCCARAGLSRAQAIFATLCLTFCPVFLGCAVAAMTDIVGLLALIACLYGCLRAVQASSDRTCVAWLTFATVVDLLLSSARQIDFIGALVLVPSAVVYLSFRKRSLVVVGALLWLFSLAVSASLLRWFSHQPYILPQSMIPTPFDKGMIPRSVTVLAYAALDSGILMLPAFLMLVGMWRRASLRAVLLTAGATVAFLAMHLAFYRTHHYTQRFAPFFLVTFYHQTAENTFNSMMMPPKGLPPVGLPQWVRAGLTVLSLGAAATVFLTILSRKRLGSEDEVDPISWNGLLVLVAPVFLVYLLLLLPRGVIMTPPDRYLLGFFPFGLLVLMRFYRRHFGDGVPAIAKAALAITAIYSVTTVHDAFAVFRANLRVIDELRAAGVPRTEIDGGWEYNFETQVIRHGHTEAGGITLPNGSILSPPRPVERGPCGELLPLYSPDVHAQYAVAYPVSSCQEVSLAKPVDYTTWLPPFRRQLVAVKAQPDQWVPYQGQ